MVYAQWDINGTIARFLNEGVQVLLDDAGVTLDGVLPSITGPQTCNVCFEDVEADETLSLQCGHVFCKG